MGDQDGKRVRGKGGTQRGVPARTKKGKEKMEEPRWGETRTLPKGHREDGPEEES